MSRRVRDPIAQHSASLCEYMNARPAIILSYARYFGEYPEATKATMTAVDQDGFDIVCQDNGQERELRVTFGHSLHAVSQVKDAFMALAREAEIALRGDDRLGQDLMPDSPSVSWPGIDPVAASALLIAYTAIYLNYFPNTTSPALQWILQTIGSSSVHYIAMLVVGLHVIESVVSLYFTIVVSTGFFGSVDVVQWFAVILLFGYPFLFKLISLSTRQQTKGKIV